MLHVSGYGRGGPKSDRPGLRHPGRGHERVRPGHRPARRAARRCRRSCWPTAWRARPATYAVMMALYHRDVHGGDGPARRRQPDRAAGPAHRVVHPGLRPARRRSPAGWATASTPARPATPTAPPTTSGWPSPARRPTSPCGSTAPSTVPTWPRTPTTSTPSAARQRAGEVDELVADWVGAADAGRGHGGVRARPRWPPPPSTTPSSCSADEHLRGPGHLRRGRRPRPRPDDRVRRRSPSLSETPGAIDHLGPASGRRQRRGVRRAARPRRRPARRAAGGRRHLTTHRTTGGNRARTPSPTIRAGHPGQQRADVREGGRAPAPTSCSSTWRTPARRRPRSRPGPSRSAP